MEKKASLWAICVSMQGGASRHLNSLSLSGESLAWSPVSWDSQLKVPGHKHVPQQMGVLRCLLSPGQCTAACALHLLLGWTVTEQGFVLRPPAPCSVSLKYLLMDLSSPKWSRNTSLSEDKLH